MFSGTSKQAGKFKNRFLTRRTGNVGDLTDAVISRKRKDREEESVLRLRADCEESEVFKTSRLVGKSPEKRPEMEEILKKLEKLELKRNVEK
ncbi:Protein of unknown function [Cotesia congregata]|uniref:Uncharacterized protein n=1 Tax=Cotesia congregata TaxID=51543 RepID=A0A8J2HFE7_COTCN|nr:Protein of unknown function [Cotesia congregata]